MSSKIVTKEAVEKFVNMFPDLFDEDFLLHDEICAQDLLWGALGESCGGYNSAIDADILSCMREMAGDNPSFNTDISTKLQLDPKYIEIIQYLVCGAGLAEYGTSPRGAWLTQKGLDFVKAFDQLVIC